MALPAPTSSDPRLPSTCRIDPGKLRKNDTTAVTPTDTAPLIAFSAPVKVSLIRFHAPDTMDLIPFMAWRQLPVSRPSATCTTPFTMVITSVMIFATDWNTLVTTGSSARMTGTTADVMNWTSWASGGTIAATAAITAEITGREG